MLVASPPGKRYYKSMIEFTHYPGFLAGLLAGSLHATMLWRSSHRLSVWTPLLGLLRLAVVAVVLLLAAVYGQVVAAAAGWMICFAVSVILYYCHGFKNARNTSAFKSMASGDAKCH